MNITINKLNKTVVLLTLMSTFGLSCSKLVDVPASPPTQILEEDLFADSATAMTAVAGVYSYPTASSGNFTFNDGYLTVTASLYADEVVTTQTEPEDRDVANSAVPIDNSYIGYLWDAPYKGLYPVNAILKGVAESKGLTESFKTRITAEMKVLRALYYFHLVNQFGAVPLIKSTDYKNTAILPRSSVDSVYAFILKDLEDADAVLSPEYPSFSRARVNLYAAKSLLSKVHLFRGNWQAAFDEANTVIESNVYQLEPMLNNVFLKGSTEAIWQLPGNTPGSNYRIAEASKFVAQSAGTIPSYPVSPSLLSAFEANDERKNQWLGSSVVDFNGNVMTFYYPYKYKNVGFDGTTYEDYVIFRLGELYLIRAEAAAHLGKLRDALDDVDRLRDRAGLLPSTASDTDADEVFTAIMHERQTELFCEWGNRLFDLKRTGKVDEVLGAIKPDWQDFREIYPIPLVQLRLNASLIQNPGYN